MLDSKNRVMKLQVDAAVAALKLAKVALPKTGKGALFIRTSEKKR